MMQAVTGFGFALISAPFLVAAYRAPEGVQLNLVLSLILNAVLLSRERRHVDGKAAALLLVPAVIITLPAAFVVHHVAQRPLTVAAGLVCLVGVVATASRRQLPVLARRRGAAAAGSLSGAMNVVSGMSGPPVVLFALNAGWRPDRTRPTLQLYFLGLNTAALTVLGFPDRFPVILLSTLAAGALTGALLARRPPDGAVRAATLLVAAAGSMLALGRGLIG